MPTNAQIAAALSQIVAALGVIEIQLNQIEAELQNRSAPAPEIRQALEDIERSYGLIAQVAEVARVQSEQIEKQRAVGQEQAVALAEAFDRLYTLFVGHDAKEIAIWEEVRQWMVGRIDTEEWRRELEEVENTAFVTQQIIPIMQKMRDEMVLLRGDVRELRGVLASSGRQVARGEDARPEES